MNLFSSRIAYRTQESLRQIGSARRCLPIPADACLSLKWRFVTSPLHQGSSGSDGSLGS